MSTMQPEMFIFTTSTFQEPKVTVTSLYCFSCPSLDDPPQDVDKSRLSESTSTTTNLNETCSLDTSCDRLLHLDSPSLSSELQDTSSVEGVEIELFPDFEEPLESNNFYQQMFSLYNMTMTCSYSIKRLILHLTISTIRTLMSVKKEGQDDFLIHATNLSHNFALPQFMAQHNCEDPKPIDAPSTLSTFTQAFQ